MNPSILNLRESPTNNYAYPYNFVAIRFLNLKKYNFINTLITSDLLNTDVRLNPTFQLKLNDKIEQITSSGSFQWDLNNHSFYCSENFLRITGIEGDRHNFDSRFFFSLIEQKKRNHVLEVMHECVTLNKDFEVTFQLSSSKRKIIKMHGYPEGDVKGKILTGFIVDISDSVHSDHEILKGQDMERKRMSMELHDSVGQKCIALKYMLTLRKMKNDFSDFDTISESIDEIINEIRSITHNLSNEIVAEIGLEKAIRQIVNECAKAIDAEVSLEFSLSEDVILSLDLKKMLYRIIQEALSNIMKYSHAKKLSVSLKNQNNQIILRIKDDGVGFDITKVALGIGIQNIKKRVSYLNGFVNIDSIIGEGTKTTIKIPI